MYWLHENVINVTFKATENPVSLMPFLSSSSPGSQREPTCMRVQWPKASHWTLWRSERWRGRPASSTLWPSSGNRRQQRTTPGSITSTVTLCLWVWKRKRRSGGPKPCRDQRSKLHRRCHCRFRSTPVTLQVASSWTLPSFTCSSEAGEEGRSCLNATRAWWFWKVWGLTHAAVSIKSYVTMYHVGALLNLHKLCCLKVVTYLFT